MCFTDNSLVCCQFAFCRFYLMAMPLEKREVINQAWEQNNPHAFISSLRVLFTLITIRLKMCRGNNMYYKDHLNRAIKNRTSLTFNFLVSIDFSGLVSAQNKEEELILVLNNFCRLKISISVDGPLPDTLYHRKIPFLQTLPAWSVVRTD